ncbi:hypothetical protein Aduo_013346 [Ancylostoma duodenale]
MFRVFQRTKIQKSAEDADFRGSKTDLGSSSTSGSSAAVNVRTKPSPMARSPSSSESQPGRSRRKSGLMEKDQEFYRKKGEEQEEFENVSAVVRPAATKMRKAKLKWKTETDPVEEVSARSAEKGEKPFMES